MMYVKPLRRFATGRGGSGRCGGGRQSASAGIDRIRDDGPRQQPAGAATGRCATLEQPRDAELQLVGQRDLGDRDVDDHLPLRDVELLERRLDDRVLGRRCDHQQLVGVLVRHDLQVADDADALGAAGRRGSGRLIDDDRRRRGSEGLRAERRRIDDRARRRTGRERGRRRCRRLRRAAGERLLQQGRQALRARVLQVVHEELQAAAFAALVEALDPLLDLLEIGRLRRDDEQRVHPLDRHDLEDPRDRTGIPVADELLELRHHRLDVRVLQREHAGRHARHPVDVEHVDGFHQMPQFALGPGQDQHVAQLVRSHRLRILGERLEDPQHFAHADVTQRHDLHREPRRQRARRIPELRRDVAAHRGGLRHHHVQAAALDHRRAVGAQQRFQRRRQRIPRNARRGPDGHGAADRGIDRVILVEDVAQDVAHHFAQIGAFEIQHDVAPGGLHAPGPGGAPPPGCMAFHDHAGAPVEEGLRLFLGGRHTGCRARGGVGKFRSQRRPGCHLLARVGGHWRRRLACDEQQRQRPGYGATQKVSIRHCSYRLPIVVVSSRHAAPRHAGGRLSQVAGAPRHRRGCW